MKIIILNLNRSTKEEALLKLFKTYGNVASLTLVKDKETSASKGFGFVEMPNEEEANAAISGLHGTNVDNNKIRVKPSNENK